jgi:hypothetical protein
MTRGAEMSQMNEFPENIVPPRAVQEDVLSRVPFEVRKVCAAAAGTASASTANDDVTRRERASIADVLLLWNFFIVPPAP